MEEQSFGAKVRAENLIWAAKKKQMVDIRELLKEHST